jgi:predicted hydrolase (HD superfamily)
MLNDRHDAYRLLEQLGASTRLLRHLALVGEAADLLMREYADLGLDFDATLIELGVAVHDAGKILHPSELDAPGHRHETAGETMLLANGVQPNVAKCCISHAEWAAHDVSFEERSIALADKLWKGKRETALELLVIDMAAARLGAGRWDVFERLDAAFEAIAAQGDERLARSRMD